MDRLYTIDTGYANAGVVVHNDLIVEAAPIFKWMVGKKWSNVINWHRIKWDHAHIKEPDDEQQ